VLVLEHLHHLVGDKDGVERIGPVMFPSRWKIALLSNWNRAKRLGRLTQISLGPVGHQVPGGMLDPDLKLPDGRTSLQQSIDYINDIVAGRWETIDPTLKRTASAYEARVAARPAEPALAPAPNPDRYLPVAPWIGRLVLPKPGERFGGVWMDVVHAPSEYRQLAGTAVRLKYAEDEPALKELLRAVTRDVSFSAEARYTSTYRGLVHPTRLDRWRLVNPLESLAGAHPFDDVVVKLAGNVRVENEDGGTILWVDRTPVQIGGAYYALVRFLETQDDALRPVEHYDAIAGTFTGASRMVRLKTALPGLETSPLNELGWYAYGALGADGTFEATAIVPRLWLRPPGVPIDGGDAYRLYRSKLWSVVTGSPKEAIAAATHERWQPGDAALLVLTAGGDPIGRFAYGIAEAIEDPLAGELRFETTYYELYPSNTNGTISGPADAARCIGDLDAGEALLSPVAQTVLAHVEFPLSELAAQLDAMSARYRIGDGTGGTYDGIANNCSQDSNRALFAALRRLHRRPHQRALAQRLHRRLAPFGAVPREWKKTNAYDLGSTFEDAPVPNLLRGLRTWRCILPRMAAESVAKSFVQEHGEIAVAGMPAFSPSSGRSGVAPLTLWP
jgi:predicted Abi (CAAX) family protease